MRTFPRAMKIALVAVLLLAAIPLLYFGGLFAAHGFSRDFLAIDSCLDSGGRWDYSRRCCEH
jgi:hypothetical protein